MGISWLSGLLPERTLPIWACEHPPWPTCSPSGLRGGKRQVGSHPHHWPGLPGTWPLHLSKPWRSVVVPFTSGADEMLCLGMAWEGGALVSKYGRCRVEGPWCNEVPKLHKRKAEESRTLSAFILKLVYVLLLVWFQFLKSQMVGKMACNERNKGNGDFTCWLMVAPSPLAWLQG